jgi:hypothetical protein
MGDFDPASEPEELTSRTQKVGGMASKRNNEN